MSPGPTVGFPLASTVKPGLQKAMAIMRELHPREKDGELLARIMVAGIQTVLDNIHAPTKTIRALRITGCRDALMWYAELVGRTVPYCGQWPEAYTSKEPAGYFNRVEFSDAELVDILPDGTIVPVRRT